MHNVTRGACSGVQPLHILRGPAVQLQGHGPTRPEHGPFTGSNPKAEVPATRDGALQLQHRSDGLHDAVFGQPLQVGQFLLQGSPPGEGCASTRPGPRIHRPHEKNGSRLREPAACFPEEVRQGHDQNGERARLNGP